MNQKLKPCPFCGVDPINASAFGMLCAEHPMNDCYFRGASWPAERWNRRAAQPVEPPKLPTMEDLYGSAVKHPKVLRNPEALGELGESPKGRECWVLARPDGTLTSHSLSRHPDPDRDAYPPGYRWIRMHEALRVPALEIIDQEKGWDGMPVRVRISNGTSSEWYFCKGHPMAQVVPAVEAEPEPSKESQSIGPRCGECGEWCESCRNGKNRIDGGPAPLGSQGGRKVPDGFRAIEAYTDFKTVVVMGNPVILDGDNHNCDAMGCGSTGHVIARLPILRAPEGPQGEASAPISVTMTLGEAKALGIKIIGNGVEGEAGKP